ncbi:MmgE/PrpD family protein [Chloroflexota bacterium]
MVQRDAAFEISSHLANIQYQDLPKATVEAAKNSILDTIGVMLGASGIAPESAQMADMVRETGGKEESTIIGFGGKVPAHMAAFVNGSMSHALDYDDIVDEAMVHVTAPVLPAALAFAERLDNVSGKDLITAVALGNDIVARMGLAITRRASGYKGDWHITVVFGIFGATAACGRLLNFDKDKMASALGIALNQASGSLQMAYSTGTPLRGMYNAFPAKGGVISALMEEHGISGPRDSLQSDCGLFELYFKGDYNPTPLTDGLGEKFEGANVSFKTYPSCRQTHAYVDATLGIMHEQGISNKDIDEIEIIGGDISRTLCEPLEVRRSPKVSIDAKFSIPFTVALAVAKGKIALEHFTAKGLSDPETLKVAKKVVPKYDTSLNTPSLSPAIVNIRTKSGETLSKRVDIPMGHPKNPLTPERMAEKFRDCALHSAKPIPKENAEKVIELITSLEAVDDINRIVRLLPN